MSMDKIGIKLEEDRSTKHTCDMKLKVEEDRITKQSCDMKVEVESQFPGAKANLTKLPTAKEQLKLGKHKMAKQLLNSKFNLVSDWILEPRPKNLSTKRYKRRIKSTLKFVFQEYPQFNLAGDIVQVKDDISKIETGVKIEPLDGAKFIYLSDYIVVEINNPRYSGVAMGMSKEENVAMLFSKVSKRRSQQINKKRWEKAKDTLNQAQSAAYTNVRGKKMYRNQLNICVLWPP
jgi:hypothetical protein